MVFPRKADLLHRDAHQILVFSAFVALAAVLSDL
jgi:hypothetical protein